VCGAVTGGIFVLGLRHRCGSTGDHSATELTCLRTRGLMDRFAARHGSCLCRQLLQGYDLSTEDRLRCAKADDMLNKVCWPCVQTIVQIFEQMK
jgi:C_GCAxxG_C_C family probable redox protein